VMVNDAPGFTPDTVMVPLTAPAAANPLRQKQAANAQSFELVRAVDVLTGGHRR